MAHQTKAELDAKEQRKQLVDEFGQLDAELQPFAAKQRRKEDLAKLIRSWYSDADPEATHVSAGNAYEVILGPAQQQTHFAEIAEIYKALGKAKFLLVCSITVKALEAVATGAQLLTLTHKKRTGSRTLVAKAKEAIAKAA